MRKRANTKKPPVILKSKMTVLKIKKINFR